jgi:hypothetical protein
MDRRQDQIVLVKQRNTSLATGGVGRIERKLGQEALTRGIAARNLFKLDQIRSADFRVFVDALKMRLIPETREFEIARPFGIAKASNRLDKRGPISAGSSWGL